MAQIARGTTGQADLADIQEGNPFCGLPGYAGNWQIDLDGVGAVAVYEFNEYWGPQAGWNNTEGGMVTVPVDATPGTYRAYYTGGACGVDGNLYYVYEFEALNTIITPPGPGDPICKL